MLQPHVPLGDFATKPRLHLLVGSVERPREIIGEGHRLRSLALVVGVETLQRHMQFCASTPVRGRYARPAESLVQPDGKFGNVANRGDVIAHAWLLIFCVVGVHCVVGGGGALDQATEASDQVKYSEYVLNAPFGCANIRDQLLEFTVDLKIVLRDVRARCWVSSFV